MIKKKNKKSEIDSIKKDKLLLALQWGYTKKYTLTHRFQGRESLLHGKEGGNIFFSCISNCQLSVSKSLVSLVYFQLDPEKDNTNPGDQTQWQKQEDTGINKKTMWRSDKRIFQEAFENLLVQEDNDYKEIDKR